METETYVGLVGLGTIGQHHAEQLTALTGMRDVALAGGMDIAESAREQFETTFDVPTFNSHEALYEHVDAVIITTPNRYHEEYALAAFEAGLDMEILKYVHDTDGTAVESPDLSAEQERLEHEQRALSRKEHGSANHGKQRHQKSPISGWRTRREASRHRRPRGFAFRD